MSFHAAVAARNPQMPRRATVVGAAAAGRAKTIASSREQGTGTTSKQHTITSALASTQGGGAAMAAATVNRQFNGGRHLAAQHSSCTPVPGHPCCSPRPPLRRTAPVATRRLNEKCRSTLLRSVCQKNRGTSYAAGTGGAKASAPVCNAYEAAAVAPVPKRERGKRAAPSMMIDSKTNASAATTAGLPARNSSRKRPAATEPQKVPNSGTDGKRASGADPSEASMQGRKRNMMKIRRPIRACALGGVLLLQILRTSDRPALFSCLLGAFDHQGEAFAFFFLPFSLHIHSCNSTSAPQRSSDTICVNWEYNQNAAKQNSLDETQQLNDSNKGESFGRLVRFSPCRRRKNFWQSKSCCLCTYGVGEGAGPAGRSSSRTHMCMSPDSCNRSRLRNSTWESGIISRRTDEVVNPSWCSGSSTYLSDRKTLSDVSHSVLWGSPAIDVLKGRSPPNSSSCGSTSTYVRSSKIWAARFAGPSLLFAAADAGCCQGGTGEHQTECTDNCVSRLSSPGQDTWLVPSAAAGRPATVQEQQPVEELQLPALQHEDELQLSAVEQSVEGPQVPEQKDAVDQMQAPAQQQVGKGDDEHDLVKQRDKEVAADHFDKDNEEQEHGVEAVVLQDLEQRQPEQAGNENQGDQGFVASGVQACVGGMPEVNDVQEDEDDQPQHTEDLEEHPFVGIGHMGEQDAVLTAEGVYLSRQQAVSAAVAGLLPVGRTYDFMPLTKRLSTAKRLNLLEESEGYEEFFSGEFTEAIDAERSRSGGAGCVAAVEGPPRTPDRSPQDTVADSLGARLGPATGTERKSKTDGERPDAAQEGAVNAKGVPENTLAGSLGGKLMVSGIGSVDATHAQTPFVALSAGPHIESMSQGVEQREDAVCQDGAKELNCPTAAPGGGQQRSTLNEEFPDTHSEAPEVGVTVEQTLGGAVTVAPGEKMKEGSFPSVSATVSGYMQKKGSPETALQKTAGNEGETVVEFPMQVEHLPASEGPDVTSDDRNEALLLHAGAGEAAVGATELRPNDVYKADTDAEPQQEVAEEMLNSDGGEEDGDEGDGEEEDEEDEEDLTSRLPVRRRPLEAIELTSPGYEDIPAAERGHHGAHGSVSSVAADVLSRGSHFSDRPPAARPVPHTPAAPATYSYSGTTVGSPLPSSYATLPLLISSYNAGAPPGVGSAPSAAPQFVRERVIRSPVPPLSSTTHRHTGWHAQVRTAAGENAELRADGSSSRWVSLFGSDPTVPVELRPGVLDISSAPARAPSPSPFLPDTRPISGPPGRAAAVVPSPSRTPVNASLKSRATSVPHAVDADGRTEYSRIAVPAAAPALYPEAALPRHISRSHAAAEAPSPVAARADASRLRRAGVLDPHFSSLEAVAPGASAPGKAAVCPHASSVTQLQSPGKAMEGRTTLPAVSRTVADHSTANGYPGDTGRRDGYPGAAAYSADTSYGSAKQVFSAPPPTDGISGVSHAAHLVSAESNDTSSGSNLSRPEKPLSRDAVDMYGPLGVHEEDEGAAGDDVTPSGVSAALPEYTVGSSSTAGDTAILAATMAAAAARLRTPAAKSVQRLDSVVPSSANGAPSKGIMAHRLVNGDVAVRAAAVARPTVGAPELTGEGAFEPGEQTVRRLYEGAEQLYNSRDPRVALPSAAGASAGTAAAAEKQRSGTGAAEGLMEVRGQTGHGEARQPQRVGNGNSHTSAVYRGGGPEGNGGRAPAATVPGRAALQDDSIQEPQYAEPSRRGHVPIIGERRVSAAGRKSSVPRTESGAGGADGSADALGAPGSLRAAAPLTRANFSGRRGPREDLGELRELDRDIYHPDAASEASTLSTTGATSSLAEASFKKPSDALKNLVARQDAGEWQHEREAFERHYPFRKPIVVRSTTTGRVFEITFDSVLGAGGQGVVFAATILSEGTGVALKIFRIRPEQRRDEGREEGMLRRRVQSELNVWDYIPGGLSPREWSEFAHLVIPLDVVQPLKIHKSPPRHEVRYATQWIMMELFAGDMARMPKIMSASASVKMEVTEQMFLSNMRLHDMGLVHSDIKLPNFFIGTDGRIFLGDHSLATPTGENVACMSGTVRYLPPENMKCINDGRRRIMTTERKDVWALGIVLHKLWCGLQYPYEIGELWSRDLFVRAARAHVDELDLTGCDKMTTVPILGLLRIMLTPQVSKRPTLREIHKFHPLFAPQKNTIMRSRTLHSLLEEIQPMRGKFEASKYAGGLALKHTFFGGADLKR